ncbi:MAG: hypothetical protein ACFFBP_09520 [Promethearchaeota archaeon]
MTVSNNKNLMNKSQDSTKQTSNHQIVIEKVEEDTNKLELLLKGIHEKRESLHDYNVKHFKGKIDDMEASTVFSRFEVLKSKQIDKEKKIHEKINQFFENVYDKIPGYFFGILGIMIYAFSTFLALALYLYIDPEYSIFNNWISDLGIGPIQASIVFNTGWIISSMMFLFFNIYEIKKLKKKINRNYIFKLMALSNISFSLGICFVAIFSEHLFVFHVIGVEFYFLGSFGFFSYYAILAVLYKEIPFTHFIIAYFTYACHIAFFISPYYPESFSEIGLTITSLEWLTFIAQILMMLTILRHSIAEDLNLRKFEKERENIRDLGIIKPKIKINLSK